MSWRYRRRDYGWGGFAPYVSKAEKMRHAEKARAKLLKKKGAEIQPIVLDGHAIARTWWGKAWNQNLERYSDYSNRLPRGRSYVRNGSVLDLKIAANTVIAIVAGSRPKPYDVTIRIKPLGKKVEQALMTRSRTALDSMQSLLSGEFPAELKESFLEKGKGLFPSPQEIAFSCSCPDWASMCKHVAAALYGTAVRLDERPELFFVLRGIRIDDFVGQIVKRESEKMLHKAESKSGRVIEADGGDLSKLFGIAMDGAEVGDQGAAVTAAPIPVRKGAKSSTKPSGNARKVAGRRPACGQAPCEPASPAPKNANRAPGRSKVKRRTARPSEANETSTPAVAANSVTAGLRGT